MITIPSLQNKDMVDRYQILEEVGQGGMATVYRGRDTTLHREVAIKILHPHLARDPMHRRRFRREAQAVARLQHSGIIEVYDFSSEENSFDEEKSQAPVYLVMKFVEGQNLQEFLEAKEEFGLCELGACFVFHMANALEHAHKQGVIHRDLKPENVLINNDGKVKLTDFGLARIMDGESMTRTGTILGSPAYMAPEQVEGQVGNHRVDLFALGVILYRLVCQSHPFQQNNPAATLQAVMTSKYKDPEIVRPGIGKELTRIIRRSLERDPLARYSKVSELKHDLSHYLHDSGIEQPEAILRSYLLHPRATEPRVQARIVAHLKQRADKLIQEKRFAAAMDVCNRVLALVPDDPEVARLISRITERDQWQKRGIHAAVAASLLAVVGLGSWAGIHYWEELVPSSKKPKLVSQKSTTTKARKADARNGVRLLGKKPLAKRASLSPTQSVAMAVRGTQPSRDRIPLVRSELPPHSDKPKTKGQPNKTHLPRRTRPLPPVPERNLRLRSAWRRVRAFRYPLFIKYTEQSGKRYVSVKSSSRRQVGKVQLGDGRKKTLLRRSQDFRLRGSGPYRLRFFRSRKRYRVWRIQAPEHRLKPSSPPSERPDVRRATPPERSKVPVPKRGPVRVAAMGPPTLRPMDTKSYPKRKIHFHIAPWARLYTNSGGGFLVTGQSPGSPLELRSGPKPGRIWRVQARHLLGKTIHLWFRIPEKGPIFYRTSSRGRWRPMMVERGMSTFRRRIEFRSAYILAYSPIHEATLWFGVQTGSSVRAVRTYVLSKKPQRFEVPWNWRIPKKKFVFKVFHKHYKTWSRSRMISAGETFALGRIQLNPKKGTKAPLMRKSAPIPRQVAPTKPLAPKPTPRTRKVAPLDPSKGKK